MPQQNSGLAALTPLQPSPRKVEVRSTGRNKPRTSKPEGLNAPACCRSLLPSRRNPHLRTSETRSFRQDDAHAGFPQGFLTTRWMNSHPSRSCLLSRFLADECNQPNCQRAQHDVVIRTPLPHGLFTGARRDHRPVQAARWHLAPAVMTETRTA